MVIPDWQWQIIKKFMNCISGDLNRIANSLDKLVKVEEEKHAIRKFNIAPNTDATIEKIAREFGKD